MEIKIAKYSGYCFGVKRAMDIAWDELDKKDSAESVYSLGPLIHNNQAMKKYIEKGLSVEDEIGNIKKNSTAIVRSHGLPKYFYDKMKEESIKIIDATCPFVKKIQIIVYENYGNGSKIIIIGDKNHPEVIGINGWANNSSIIINSLEDADKLCCNDTEKYIVVVQTTYKLEKYQQIEKILKNRLKKVEFFNTICYATRERQDAARELSRQVDAMIVIGGSSSSNTKKLAEICAENCITFLIETAEELDFKKIENFEKIGISAGASTPDFIIKEVEDLIVNKINI
ncbi:MAG: 4-hydroxy-3-methylbut-2-enyl diphosphate reductase [Proteocatella sp.]